MKTVKAVIFAATFALASAANAALIKFSDFDSIAVPAGSFINTASADDWTGGAGGIEIQNNAAGAPFSSPNLVELDTFANSSMFYTLGAGSYSVSYYYSPRPGVAAASNGIELSVGSTLLDSVTANGSASTQWALRSVSFTTTGGPLTFTSVGTSDSLGGYIDSISISAVPEPSSWALLVAGFGMIGFAARRNRKAIVA